MTTTRIPFPPAPALSAAQRASLRRVAGMMIPPSDAYGVPGADDAAIFADVAATLGRDAPAVRDALARLDALAGGPFADASADLQAGAVQALRTGHPSAAAVLVTVVVRCYYRDDRVMRALGMEVRPPFPKGFEVADGDWSILDPVRQGPRRWRDAG
jgi:hypothetical protein